MVRVRALAWLVVAAFVAAAAADESPVSAPSSEAESLVATLEKHKELAVRVGGGFVGGYVAALVVKATAKFGVVIGFLFYVAVSMGVSIPKWVVEELHMESTAELIEEKTKNVFDVNNDGRMDMSDVEAAKKKLGRFIRKHIPLSGGFAAGFAFGL